MADSLHTMMKEARRAHPGSSPEEIAEMIVASIPPEDLRRRCAQLLEIAILNSAPLPGDYPHRTVMRHDDGTVEFYQDGLLHREDGPAVVTKEGISVWYHHGVPSQRGPIESVEEFLDTFQDR